MIKSFKHKGLRLFYETGKTGGVQNNHVRRLRMQLLALDTAQAIEDMDIPGYHLHKLKGKKSALWSLRVSKNWRLTFVFEDGDVHVLDYEDYH